MATLENAVTSSKPLRIRALSLCVKKNFRGYAYGLRFAGKPSTLAA